MQIIQGVVFYVKSWSYLLIFLWEIHKLFNFYSLYSCPKTLPMQVEIKSPDITDEYLSGLDSNALIDLLVHHTKLLLVAINCKLPDRDYIDTIRLEVQKIQVWIKSHSADSTPFR